MSQVAADAPQGGFDIDGRTYPVPDLDGLTMEEAQVLYDYSGLVIEDFLPPDEDDEYYSPDQMMAFEEELEVKVKNPGFMRALVHIAYQRGNPTAKRVHVEQVVKNANFMGQIVGFVTASQAGDDASPPSPSGPELPKNTNSGDSPANSSPHSGNGSDVPETTPDDTGITKSLTSPEPDPTT